MNPVVARVAAISLGLTAAGAAAGAVGMVFSPDLTTACLLFAKDLVFPGPESRLAEEGPPRNAQVLAEIAGLGQHPWAGVYRTKARWPDELAVAPEAGLTLHEGSRCGTCARYSAVGRILAVRDTALEIEVEFAERPDMSRQYVLDETLHLVRWGDLLFAVPEQRMELFCAEASDGATFPGVPFRIVENAGGLDSVDPSRPTGMPQVPSAFQHLLLQEPISCTIVELVEWQRRPELDGKELRAYEGLYSIDVGSEAGLAPGMRLCVEGGSQRVEDRGRVEGVAPKEGRLRLLLFEDRREWAESLPGTRATTLLESVGRLQGGGG